MAFPITKTLNIGARQVVVTVDKVPGDIPVYEVSATLDGETYSARLTVGPTESAGVTPNLSQLQTALDELRQKVAEVVAFRRAVRALENQLT